MSNTSDQNKTFNGNDVLESNDSASKESAQPIGTANKSEDATSIDNLPILPAVKVIPADNSHEIDAPVESGQGDNQTVSLSDNTKVIDQENIAAQSNDSAASVAVDPPGSSKKLKAPPARSAIKKIALVVAGLICAVIAFVAYETTSFLLSFGSRDQPVDVVFFIPQGARFDEVAQELYAQGIISDAKCFSLLARLRGDVGKVQAGEFLLSTGWQPICVLDQITKGKPVLYKLVIREGLTWWETARAIEEQGFAKFDDFKEVIQDKVFLREHFIPFESVEGFLFPETYTLPKPRNMTLEEEKAQARRIASMMVRMFWSKSQPLWETLPARDEPIGEGFIPSKEHKIVWPPAPTDATLTTPADLDPQALFTWVTLASLVEKETSIGNERSIVAGVFANRLRKGMLLQCDPTIVYGIGEDFSGSIRRSQLNDGNNLYNTYIHGGLPPGPIASSGLASLTAGLKPGKHQYYYFVATGIDGGHTFSRTLGEHNSAVQEYRRNIRRPE